MDHLRHLLAEMGLTGVKTYIASGNVLFDAAAPHLPSLEAQIETHLHQRLGYPVVTFIRTASEMGAIAAYTPFEPVGEHTLYIAFVKEPPDAAAQAKLQLFANEIDQFQVRGREIYWLCYKTISQSTFSGAALEKTLGQPATLRNSSTVRKLAALV